jgi:hypothetical protein
VPQCGESRVRRALRALSLSHTCTLVSLSLSHICTPVSLSVTHTHSGVWGTTVRREQSLTRTSLSLCHKNALRSLFLSVTHIHSGLSFSLSHIYTPLSLSLCHTYTHRALSSTHTHTHWCMGYHGAQGAESDEHFALSLPYIYTLVSLSLSHIFTHNHSLSLSPREAKSTTVRREQSLTRTGAVYISSLFAVRGCYLTESVCKIVLQSQFSCKSVNLSFVIDNMKNKLANLCGN